MTKLIVKEICKEKGISLKTLSEKMGITPSALSQSLNNPNPSLQSLERIAKSLHVDVAELFGRSSYPINAFVEMKNEVRAVHSREAWLDITNTMDGVVHIPQFKGPDEHRDAIAAFVRRTLRKDGSAAIVSYLGTIELIMLLYIDQKYVLVLCQGNKDISIFSYDVLEYCGEANKKEDIDLLIKEIINDAEKIFEDDDFGEPID